MNEDLDHIKKSVKFFKNMTKLYINPCTKMETSVRVNKKITTSSLTNYLRLKFKYSSNRYLEILNKKAFGFSVKPSIYQENLRFLNKTIDLLSKPMFFLGYSFLFIEYLRFAQENLSF